MECLARCQIHGSDPKPPAEFTAPPERDGEEPTHMCGTCLRVWHRSTGHNFIMRIGSSEPMAILAIIERRKRGAA